MESEGRRLIPVTQWKLHHNYPSENTLRYWIFWNKQGFRKVTRKVGRRILIDEEEYFRWIDETGSN